MNYFVQVIVVMVEQEVVPGTSCVTGAGRNTSKRKDQSKRQAQKKPKRRVLVALIANNHHLPHRLEMY